MLFDIINVLGNQQQIIITIFAYAVILLIAIPIHECSHCFMAYLLGDDTGLRSGRVTLNPIRHWDPMGTIGILTVGIGWGKPAPVNPVRGRKVSSRAFMAITAAAATIVAVTTKTFETLFTISSMPNSDRSTLETGLPLA